MTPSTTIVSGATEVRTIVDSLGRRLTLRSLTALDKLRIFKAAGPQLALNQPWLAMAIIASSVTAIDDVPIPPPSTETQIEGLVDRLGDSGIEAVAQVIEPLAEANEHERIANVGNLCGTPN